MKYPIMLKSFLSATLVSLLAVTAAPCFAQMKVYVGSTAEDSVGGRLVYAMKEKIRRSAGMILVDRDEDARIAVRVVTLDPDTAGGSGRRTIYSAVLTAQTFHNTPVDMFLTNYVGMCGTARIQECADDLVVVTDRYVTKVKTWIQNASAQSVK